MPTEPSPPVKVFFTLEFKRNVRHLSKKYHHIKSDVQPVIDQLAQGDTPGDRVPRVQYEV
jgi:hypothetical protein